jgi:hypothetical protein
VIQLCAFDWTPSLRRTSDSGVGDDLPNQAALGLFAFYSERLWRQSRKSVSEQPVFIELLIGAPENVFPAFPRHLPQGAVASLPRPGSRARSC